MEGGSNVDGDESGGTSPSRHGADTGIMSPRNLMAINLRSRENSHYCQLLINKLHGRYKFPKPYDNTKLKGNKVNTWALRKMSKALSSWKTQIGRAIIEKNKTWEELKEKESLIDEATYNLFKARC